MAAHRGGLSPRDKPFVKHWDLTFKDVRLETGFQATEARRRRFFDMSCYVIGALGWLFVIVKVGVWSPGVIACTQLALAAYIAYRFPESYIRWRVHIGAISRIITGIGCTNYSFSKGMLVGRPGSTWPMFLFTHLFAESKVMALFISWAALDLPFTIEVPVQAAFVGLCLLHNVSNCKPEAWGEGPLAARRYNTVASAMSSVLQVVVALPPSQHGLLRRLDPRFACGSVVLFFQVCVPVLLAIARYGWEARRRAAFPPGGPNAMLQFARWPWFDDAMLLVGTFCVCLLVVWPFAVTFPIVRGQDLSSVAGYPLAAVGFGMLTWRLLHLPIIAPQPWI